MFDCSALTTEQKEIAYGRVDGSKKTTIVVSRCLGFCKCRYNGDVLSSDFVESLKPYMNYITTCPEVEIGLSVPRNPVRLVNRNGAIELYQPSENRTYTEQTDRYSEKFFDSVGNIHGLILKGCSPSCGIKDVKSMRSQKNPQTLKKALASLHLMRFNETSIIC